MLRPAKMAKVTVLASRRNMRPVIETLYKLGGVHLTDFSEGNDPAMAGFRIGKPLPEGQQASERLLRLRSLARHLDLGKHAPTTRYNARDLETRIDQAIHQLELNVHSAAEAKSRIESSIDALQRERASLEPLKDLPLRLDDYHGYRTLAVFVGRAERSPAEAVGLAVPEAEVFGSPGSGVFAAFAPREKAPKVAEALSKAGAQLSEPPKGEGVVAARIDAIGRELQQLDHRLVAAQEELARFRREHADFLVAAEEHLTIEAEKAEAPLGFATSEHAFVLEGWVPEENTKSLYSALRQAIGDGFHLEVQRADDLLRAHHHGAGGELHAAHHETHDGLPSAGGEAGRGGAGAGHEPPAVKVDVPPTKFDLARPFAPFKTFTEMVSVPKYGEIDPTPVLALVLPVFLGFMIGDAGYGVLMLVIGAMMYKKLTGIPELRNIGIAVAVSGAVSLLFGAIIFADAFGIPLGVHGDVGHAAEAAAAETGAVVDAGGHAALLAIQAVSGGAALDIPGMCADHLHDAGETAWSCLTYGISPALATGLQNVHPVMLKLVDVGDMLVVSVLAAAVHLTLGLAFGIVNHWSHSKKHVVASVAWLALLVGFFSQIMFMAGTAGNDIAWAVYNGLGLNMASVELPGFTGVPFHPLLLGSMVLGAVMLAIGEGPMGVMELPAMLSNLMSYTRLAGLAIAKGAMAAAFTGLTLVAFVLEAEGNAVGFILALVGLVLFLFTQAFVFVLGVFSSGIQAIRLNYVEFFQKFYEGGGIPFTPFGRKRKYTQEA